MSRSRPETAIFIAELGYTVTVRGGRPGSVAMTLEPSAWDAALRQMAGMREPWHHPVALEFLAGQLVEPRLKTDELASLSEAALTRIGAAIVRAEPRTARRVHRLERRTGR